MAGERQQVRLAVAAFFGGTQPANDPTVCFQGGPLTSYGLGTAYPYSVRGVPDSYFTAGASPGRNWGVVLSTTALRRTVKREGYGGPTSGYRGRTYLVTCKLSLICELEHPEIAEQGLDDLIDQMLPMISADRTLGTTGGAYAGLPGGRLILQAGEGTAGTTDETSELTEIDAVKGRYGTEATVQFDAYTMVVG